MRAKALVAWVVSTLLLFAGDRACATDSQGSGKPEEARKEFVQVQLLLTQEKYTEAYAKAEKLIAEYAGDNQISRYVSFWAGVFRWKDEDSRRDFDMHTGLPPGLQARIQKMKDKKDKEALDLVKLAVVVRATTAAGPEESKPYLQELLRRFPGSTWADWAEFELINATAPELYERYRDKVWQARFRLVMQELYRMGKRFIETHPNSHMMPRALCAVASWRWIAMEGEQDPEKKREAEEEIISLRRRVLKDYPSAEYYCAKARGGLRNLLGPDCPESKGHTKEEDRTIRKFYLHAWPEHEQCVKEYLEIKREKASPGSTDPLP